MAVSPPPQPSTPSAAASSSAAGGQDDGRAVWKDDRLLKAIAQFEAGNYGDARRLSAESVKAPLEAKGAAAEVSHLGDWRMPVDTLAMAHDDAGDPELAEALYLRMLTWHEATDQFHHNRFALAQQLFAKSPEYSTVEDATWFLQTVRPDDGHAAAQIVGLLALGEEVAAKAAVALWTLALRPQQRSKICECGGLELVAKAVADYVQNPELQAAGCGTLRLLCTGHSHAKQSRQALVDRLGGAEALVNSLRRHPQDREVQREACGALRVIASKYPPGARRILDAGGIKLCLSALAECPEDDAVAEAACRALDAMQGAFEARVGETASEDLRAVVDVRLRAEREDGLMICINNVCQLTKHPELVITLSSFLKAAAMLLQDPGVRHRGLELIEPTIASMHAHPAHTRLQVAACGVLLVLSSGHLSDEGAATKEVSAGALGAVCQAMRDLPIVEELQCLGVGILMNTTRSNNEHKTMGIKAGGIAATVLAMRRFPRNALLQERSIGALLNLCDHVGRSLNCAKMGGVECTVTALRRHTSAGRVAELGCLFLCMLCDDTNLRQHVVQAGAAPVAKAVSKSGPPDARRWADELLQELVEHGVSVDIAPRELTTLPPLALQA